VDRSLTPRSPHPRAPMVVESSFLSAQGAFDHFLNLDAPALDFLPSSGVPATSTSPSRAAEIALVLPIHAEGSVLCPSPLTTMTPSVEAAAEAAVRSTAGDAGAIITHASASRKRKAASASSSPKERKRKTSSSSEISADAASKDKERMARRRAQNRRASKVSREKKKRYVVELERKNRELQQKMELLFKRNQELEERLRVANGKGIMSSPNSILRNGVDNAKEHSTHNKARQVPAAHAIIPTNNSTSGNPLIRDIIQGAAKNQFLNVGAAKPPTMPKASESAVLISQQRNAQGPVVVMLTQLQLMFSSLLMILYFHLSESSRSPKLSKPVTNACPASHSLRKSRRWWQHPSTQVTPTPPSAIGWQCSGVSSPPEQRPRPPRTATIYGCRMSSRPEFQGLGAWCNRRPHLGVT